MPSIPPGAPLSGALLSATRYTSFASAHMNLTTTHSDVPGTEVTVTVRSSQGFFLAWVVAGMQAILDPDVIIGAAALAVDGVDESRMAQWRDSAGDVGCGSPAAQFYGGALSQGTHSLKIRAWRIGGADATLRVLAPDTTLTALVIG